MHITTRPAALLALALSIAGAPAQDVVTLHSVTVDANDNVTVVYSKNFVTCAHMRFSDTSCAQYGPLTHVQNLFCTSGTNVTVTLPSTSFTGGFGVGSIVFMVHGNNGGVRSPCVTVECDGRYGAPCAGAGGAPVLAAANACPPAGGTLQLALTNGPAGSAAILGFGAAQAAQPLFGCTLLVAGIGGTIFLPLDATGAATFSMGVPPGAAGFAVTTQAFAIDPSGPQGFSATNGLLIRVQ
jgi:hypothetical protein